MVFISNTSGKNAFFELETSNQRFFIANNNFKK